MLKTLSTKTSGWEGLLCAALLLSVSVLSAQSGRGQETTDLTHVQGTNQGIFVFTGHCASCHDTAQDGAPTRYELNRLTPEEILTKMTTGSMAKYAAGLSEKEMRVTAIYVAGRPFGTADTGDASKQPNRCTGQSALANTAAPGTWNGWGADIGNSRFQPLPGLTADQVPHLSLKWAFGFPNANSAYAQPTFVGGHVFVASDAGFVYSLGAANGCVQWSYKARAGVRTAITIGRGTPPSANYLAYFGDVKGNVYAVNAETGAEIWMKRADTHPIARITGSPTLEGSRLYVPVASLEESGGGNPLYPCCTFRGSVVAYDAQTGKQIWKSYSIPEEPKPLKKTSVGTQLWGPAGAGVWSAPTVDTKRHAIYIATGNGYTEPAAEGSDAVIAFRMDNGKRLWTQQVRKEDSYVRDCPGIYRPQVPTTNKSETCPDDLGPDYDFGNAPILRTLPNGRSLIVIGQKSGDAWGLDPDKKGAVVWNQMVGLGGISGGGMQWGSAADDKLAYFPITRVDAKLGLAAIDMATGKIAWRATPPTSGNAPATVIPGVIFTGTTTGTMYAYSTTDGHLLWKYDTAHSFETVNHVPATGGGMSGSGPVVANGMLFVPSGNSDLGFGIRGNVLLAFGPE
jgi:polyvinyl alcohol dehydrogenase (cytochrome)